MCYKLNRQMYLCIYTFDLVLFSTFLSILFSVRFFLFDSKLSQTHTVQYYKHNLFLFLIFETLPESMVSILILSYRHYFIGIDTYRHGQMKRIEAENRPKTISFCFLSPMIADRFRLEAVKHVANY